MLVLSRKSGESIVLGDNTRITVIWTRSGAVRLGISAPPDVNVRRAELPCDSSRSHKRSLPLQTLS